MSFVHLFCRDSCLHMFVCNSSQDACNNKRRTDSWASEILVPREPTGDRLSVPESYPID